MSRNHNSSSARKVAFLAPEVDKIIGEEHVSDVTLYFVP